jgi:hypothetical protein
VGVWEVRVLSALVLWVDGERFELDIVRGHGCPRSEMV